MAFSCFFVYRLLSGVVGGGEFRPGDWTGGGRVVEEVATRVTRYWSFRRLQRLNSFYFVCTSLISEVQNVQSLGALPPYNWLFNFSPSLAERLAVPTRHHRPRGTKKRPPWHTMKSETGGVGLNVDNALTMWNSYPPTITGRIALSKSFHLNRFGEAK